MYTNGESCPMDTAAELWAGFKEVVYSVSIDDLIKCGFGQLDVSSKTLTMRGNTLTQSRITQLIKDVAWADNIKYFCHRYILTNPCPDGCHRNNAGTCVDTNPYVMQPLV
jgi:tRNA(Arg) A34 adenosine deaminase TadA